MFGLPARYFLAILLALAGVMLVTCGCTVCWLRWGRRHPKSVEDIRREQGKPPE
jgi:hypothetical protein